MTDASEPYLAIASDGRRFIVQAADPESAARNAMFPGDAFTIVATQPVLKLRDLLSAHELAAHLKIHYITVLEWAKAGKIPFKRIGRKFLRFDLAAVKSKMEEAR